MMYVYAHRLASAVEVTVWLMLLLALGAAQPATQEFHSSSTSHMGPLIGMTQPQSSAPQYLRRPPPRHTPRREWSPADLPRE